MDWSNSKSLNPSLDTSTGSLTYSVGRNFTIDPTVVASETTDDESENSRKVFYFQGNWWVFWTQYVGTSSYNIEYSTSSNGSNWSTPAALDSGIVYSPEFDIYLSGDTIIYAYMIINSVSWFDWRYGTVDGTSITWSISDTEASLASVHTLYNTNTIPISITEDTNHNVWMAGNVCESAMCTGDQLVGIYEWVNGSSASSWTQSDLYGPIPSDGAGDVQIVPLSSGKLAVASCYTSCYVTTYNGTAWDSPVEIVSSLSQSNGGDSTFTSMSAVSMGNTMYLVYEDTTSGTGGVKFVSYPYGGSASSITSINSVTDAETVVGLTTSGGSLFASYADSATNVVAEYSSSNNGSYWSLANNVSTTATEMDFPENFGAPYSVINTLGYTWQSGSTFPVNIEFELAPLYVPNAASIGEPWSKPGLSPYESYFTQLSEYVSPGNGLLGVAQTDLNLPGRDGLNLTISRIFSTPYSFYTNGGSNRTFEVDNFTLSKLGVGWELSFPWLGSDYLHLWDGQAYAYNWTGNAFVNHKGTNFVLDYNSNNGSYSLFDVSGTRYYFNSNEELVSITDATGNNTISFSYNGGGHISSITDDVGRIVDFNYYSNAQLHNITTGGLTWSYTYSGSNLATVTDPEGRVTSYSYFIGSNAWLIKQINYPTGAYTTYSYGSAPVGVGVTTYYVTSQNVYANTSALTKSSQFNYKIINGLVNYCNTTIADGTSTNQTRVNYVFNGPLGSSFEVNEYANKTIILQHANFYDSMGRIILSEIVSPSDTALTYSQAAYDAWGNVIYSNNTIGQESWYWYSNTNTSNTLRFGGLTKSFYTNNTINSNIHDLLLGSAVYQNPPTHDLVGYWSFDEGTGAITSDDSGYGNTGTLVNSPSWKSGSSCEFDNCLNFSELFQPIREHPHIHNHSSVVTVKLVVLVQTQLQCRDFFFHVLRYFASCRRMDCRRELCRINYLCVYGFGMGTTCSSTALAVGTFYFGTVIVTSSSQIVYLNGVNQGSGTGTGSSSDVAMQIGALSTTSNFCSCIIDDVRVYSTSLSSSQINQMYQGISETYYNYNSAGELTHIKQSHNGGWLVSTYTYDHYGNVLTYNDPLGRITDYQYSAAYDHAYLTDESTLVSNSGPLATFGIDGTGGNAAGSSAISSLSATLTTTKPDIVVVASEAAGPSSYPSVSSITDTAGLTWHSRKIFQQHGIGSATDYFDTEEWYAVATVPLTSDSITVTISASTKKFAINVFGVSGANIFNPFDPNSGVPGTASGSSTSPSVSISTSNGNDMILGLFMQNGGSTVTSGSGFSTITSAKSTGTLTMMYSEDEVVTSAQTGLAVKATYATSNAWMVIGDAIEKSIVTNVSSAYAYNFTTGWKTTYEDPNGQNTTYRYDNLGRMITEIYPPVAGIYSNTTWMYNDSANTMKVINPRGNYSVIYFDGLDRQTKVIQYASGTVYSTVKYTYNYQNLLNSSTTGEGNTTYYTYDPMGSETSIHYPTAAVQTISYNYLNNTEASVDPDGHKTIYAYDWMNDLLWVRQYNSSTSYYLTQYSYDKLQNLLSITDAKNNVTSYAYDDTQPVDQNHLPGLFHTNAIVRFYRESDRNCRPQRECD